MESGPSSFTASTPPICSVQEKVSWRKYQVDWRTSVTVGAAGVNGGGTVDWSERPNSAGPPCRSVGCPDRARAKPNCRVRPVGWPQRRAARMLGPPAQPVRPPQDSIPEPGPIDCCSTEEPPALAATWLLSPFSAARSPHKGCEW